MNPSNTICVGQEGPANALALNKDCSQVVIAGRNVFKVFSCGEDEFSEVCNLRVGKNLNLNYSSIDVAWSAIEENTLATAATNGAVVVWNLGRSGRSKQEHVFSDHKRTVNKVSFHLTEPAILISGSQDGMMKCFDLRMKEVTKTFISNCESVRDVQFSPGNPQQFAAVSENGSAQVWDVRRHERPLHQFTAHSGPVFACDWHPDQPWLATASRDKTIKVWDMQGKPTLEHTIYTIASVGHVKWRPQKKYQISSCALVLDCAVHVWHVRRPHVPLATFAEHRDVTTALAWQRGDAFLSTSRDCTLYRHHWSSAAHPVLWAPPQAVCVSARGELAQAVPRCPLPPPPPPAAAPAPPAQPALGRKQPTAGSLSASAQATLERLFPGGAGAAVTRWRAPPTALPRYRLRGGSVGSLASHNAAVARNANRHLTAHVWDVVATLYKSSETAPRAAPPPPPPRAPPPRPPKAPNEYSTVEEEPPEEVSEWAEFHNSGVLGLPTHSIYIPPAKFAKLGDDDSPGWVSAASAHYVDVDAADWTLPEEAFLPGQAHATHAHVTHVAHANATHPHDDSQDTAKAVTEELKNRKGYLTVKAQAVCDADLRLMNVDACWPGSADNATIFDNSQLKAQCETGMYGNRWLLGDYAYPNRTYLLTPLLAPQSQSELRYNSALHQTRTTIQRTFELWRRRFPVLAMKMRLTLPTTQSVIVATAILHNVCRARGVVDVTPELPLPAPDPDLDRPQAPQPQDASDRAELISGSNTSSASPGGSSGDSTHNIFTLRPSLSVDSPASAAAEPDADAPPLSLSSPPPRAPPAPAPLLAKALKQHAELGDVQTAVSVLIVLNSHRSDLFPYIEEALQEQWLLAYIELLQRHKQYNDAIEVIGLAWLGSVWSLSQQSTLIAVSCARCGRRARPQRAAAPAACDTCRARDVCAVCKQVVRGLYAWCQGCAHGGHLHHMQKWLQQQRLCPAGCGHRCQLP